jgi:hypothetical protein
MSIVVKNTTKIAVEEEVSEGVYIAPSSGSSYVQTLASGLEIKPAKELLERNIYTGTIGMVTPRTGTQSVSGTLPVELRTNSTAGSAPEYDKLIKSALGTRRQNTTDVTTKASGNTASNLKIEDADISKFNVGDIVLVKQDGEYHVSPITAVDSTASSANITLLVAHPSGDCDDSVVIAKFTTYTVAESGHKSLSVTKYMDGAIEEKAIGCRVSKMDLSGFSTGQLPSLSFGIEGLSYEKSVNAPAHTATFDSSLPPIILDAHAYMDGAEIVINELALSVENTIGFATAISEANGKISSRVVARKITGSFNPYQETDDVSNYTKFNENTEFSLFAYAKNDTGDAGEFENIVAVYMPKCLITEVAEADADGLVQESISFQASRGSAGTTNEIYICFI